MSVSAEALRIHIDYTAWASARMVEAATALSAEELVRDFGTADKSVLGSLVHVFAADRVWLGRVTGKPPAAFVSGADYSLDVLSNDWPAVLAGWKEWAADLTDASAAEQIAYKDLKGREYSQAAWMIVLHLVNHGTHHRGQVAGFLRSMGHAPKPLDLVAYYRTR